MGNKRLILTGVALAILAALWTALAYRAEIAVLTKLVGGKARKAPRMTGVKVTVDGTPVKASRYWTTEAERRMMDGLRAIEGEDPDAALDAYRTAGEALQMQMFVYLFHCGNAWYASSDYQRALESYGEAADIEWRLSVVVKMFECLHQLGRSEEAESLLMEWSEGLTTEVRQEHQLLLDVLAGSKDIGSSNEFDNVGADMKSHIWFHLAERAVRTGDCDVARQALQRCRNAGVEVPLILSALERRISCRKRGTENRQMGTHPIGPSSEQTRPKAKP